MISFLVDPFLGGITIFEDHLFLGLRSFPLLVLYLLCKLMAPLGKFPPNVCKTLMCCYVLWKKHGKEVSLEKFRSLCYVQSVGGGWFDVRHFDNRKFIKNFPKSNKGWRLSWYIATSAYDVAWLELVSTLTQFVRDERLLACA